MTLRLRQWRRDRAVHAHLIWMRMHYRRAWDEQTDSALELEDHTDRGFHFDGLIVEQIGTIAPGFNGIECGLLQHRRPTDDLKMLDGAGLRDHRLQDYGP